MLRQALTINGKPPLFHVPSRKHTQGDEHTQIPWSDYFDSKILVEIPGTSNAVQVYKAPLEEKEGPVFVMMHGCGMSAMSWALVAGVVKKEYNVMAFDFRGHGKSVFEDSEDLSADTLVNDTIHLLDTLYRSSPTPPSIVLVGHSMGGAIATRVAASGRVKGLVGLAVVDVVEGTALEALGSMQRIIASRPSSFPSMHKAIEWAVSSNTVRNLESARVSIPDQLVQRGEAGGEHDGQRWVWRTNLAQTEQHWRGWFSGLSQLFLGVRAGKLLVLAGCDRLDKDLTVGQIQGRFQMVVLPFTGHLVHEDQPEPTAATLINFANRNQFGKPLVLPPKLFPATLPKPPQ